MEIQKPKVTGLVPLGNIRQGECFWYGGELYIRGCGDNLILSEIKLCNGYVANLPYDAKVLPEPNAQIIFSRTLALQLPNEV